MAMLSIEVERSGVRDVYVSVAGELELASADELRLVLSRVVRLAWVRRVVVDLSEVTLLDSGGIGALLSGRNAATRHGITLCACNANGMVDWSLRLAGVAGVLGLPGRAGG